MLQPLLIGATFGKTSRRGCRHWRPRIDQWKSTGKRHTEKSHAQQFWSNLLRSFGVIPERIDLFERDAARASTGNTGYIDLFWSGVVLGEAKIAGARSRRRVFLSSGLSCGRFD